MKNNDPKPKAHPVIEKLVKAAGDDSVAQLEGYIGPSKGDTVRLYLTLELTSYVDIPRDALLHVEELSEGEGRVRTHVLGSREIQLVARRSVSLPAARLSAALRLGRAGGGPGGGGVPSPDDFARCVNSCIFEWLRCMETNPVLEKIPTICDDQLTACIRRCARGGGVIAPA